MYYFVFFRLWSIINFLQCANCNEVFPLSEYNCCRYHPEKPVAKEDGSQSTIFPCCGRNTLMFEPISSKSGCCFKEHEVSLSRESSLNSEDVFSELISVIELVCAEQSPHNEPSFYTLEAMIKTELSRKSKCVSVVCKEDAKRERKHPPLQKNNSTTTRNNNKSKFPVNNSLLQRKAHQSEEDASEVDEPGIVRIVIQHKDAPTRGKNPARTWNTNLPVRLNQDLQRESDIKRMHEMMKKLSVKTAGNANSSNGTTEKSETAEPGIYCRIESKIRSKLSAQQSIQQTSSSSNLHHSKPFKFR